MRRYIYIHILSILTIIELYVTFRFVIKLMRLEFTTKHAVSRHTKIETLNDYEHPDSVIQNFLIVCNIMSRIRDGS